MTSQLQAQGSGWRTWLVVASATLALGVGLLSPPAVAAAGSPTVEGVHASAATPGGGSSTGVTGSTNETRPAEDFRIDLNDACQFYTNDPKSDPMTRGSGIVSVLCKLADGHYVDGVNLDDYCAAQRAIGAYFTAEIEQSLQEWRCVAHPKPAWPNEFKIDFEVACPVLTDDPNARPVIKDPKDPYSLYCQLSSGVLVNSFGLTKYCDTRSTPDFAFTAALKDRDSVNWWCVPHMRLPEAKEFRVNLYKACTFVTGDPGAIPWETVFADPWSVYCQSSKGIRQQLDQADITSYCMTAADNTNDYDAIRNDSLQAGWWCAPFVRDPSFWVRNWPGGMNAVCRRMTGDPQATADYANPSDPNSWFCQLRSGEQQHLDLALFCPLFDNGRFNFLAENKTKNVFDWRCSARRRNPKTPTKIVAIGDSFTAGFGYYSDGSEMSGFRLPWCKPGDKLNDACSSNSTRENADDDNIQFSQDFGLANRVSWAANFAAGLGVNPGNASQYYRNFAVTGSTALQWNVGKLRFNQYNRKNALNVVADEQPRIVLMTLGGNPTLGKLLIGEGVSRCIGKVNEDLWNCVATLVKLDATYSSLRGVYRFLLNNTNAKIIVQPYPEVVPALTVFSAEQLLVARSAINDAVVRAISDTREDLPNKASRLHWVNTDFNVGIPPGAFSSWAACFGKSAWGLGADGPSNMSYNTQSLFIISRIASGWCPGEPSLIDGDTGIHPNMQGYRQMADSALWLWDNWPVPGAANKGDIRPGRLLTTKVARRSVRSGTPVRIPVSYVGRGSTVTAQIMGRSNAGCAAGSAGSESCVAASRAKVIGSGKVTSSEKVLRVRMPRQPGTYSLQLNLTSHNIHTDGPPTTVTVRVASRTVPAAPRAVSGTPRQRAVKVHWKAPADNGGSTITRYQVSASPSTRTCITTRETTCTLTQLSPRRAFRFKVRAANSQGWGPWSTASHRVTPQPGAERGNG
ncbi:MAG: fibronectin type III domain-containing protein [Candidatus Nanopelagicales bacterium]